MKPPDLQGRYAFDMPETVELPGGVTRTVWAELHNCRAQVIYARGSEVIEAARLEGRPIYKLKIRQCADARKITTDGRARDIRRGLPSGEGADPLPGSRYSIREVDSITSRQWIYVVIEGGKAP